MTKKVARMPRLRSAGRTIASASALPSSNVRMIALSGSGARRCRDSASSCSETVWKPCEAARRSPGGAPQAREGEQAHNPPPRHTRGAAPPPPGGRPGGRPAKRGGGGEKKGRPPAAPPPAPHPPPPPPPPPPPQLDEP